MGVDELHGEERIEVRVGERGAAETKALQRRAALQIRAATKAGP